ncbi:hypothetical protein B0H14DRAFT_3534352 [Mycena olivaceomarginata]|nr:hypothetical protein B0H14DRAFT_3534352 [Mycena olivaceomarginata]
MKYPPNTMCVFKIFAAWPAAEILPSYGGAFAPHVLISVANVKPVEVPQQMSCTLAMSPSPPPDARGLT